MILKSFSKTSILTVVILCAHSLPVNAGFEWTPPPAKVPMAEQPSSLTPDMPAIPAADVETTELQAPGTQPDAPMIDPNPLARARPPVMDPSQAASMTSSPAQEPLPATPVSAPSGMPDAVGFGSDIPLVLAMRQIVPAEYAYSFDPSVDQGMRVTWNGGKPWDLVLNEALQPAGLEAVIVGNAIRIQAISLQPVPAAEEVSAPPQAVAADAPVPVIPDGMAQEMKPLSEPEKKVQEVYIRRNSNESDSVERTTGTPGAERDQEDGFWQWLGVEPSAGGTADDQSANLSSSRVWSAKQGDSLKDIIQGWADNAGVDLVWVAARDYTVTRPVSVDGDFSDAVMEILSSYDGETERPVGKLHANTLKGSSVLVIEEDQGV